MESHPLAKLIIGVMGLGMVGIAIWLGRSGGSLPVDDIGNQPQNAEALPQEKEDFERPTISEKGPYPKVKLDEDKHDFSVMMVGSNGSHSFKIRNVGDAPLVLTKGPSTCKCTIADLAAGEIPPGGSASIDLTWEALVVVPQFQQTATIYTNDPDRTELDLVIRGKITEIIEIAPEGSWYVREFSTENVGTVSGSIFSYILDSMKIGEVQISSDALSYEFVPMTKEKLESLQAKSGYVVRVNVDSKIAIGRFREKLTFQIENQDIEPIEVYIEGNRTGPITFLATRRTRWNRGRSLIHLGEIDAKMGASGSLLLFVKGLADSELELTSVKSVPDDLQITLIPDPAFKGVGRKKYKLEFKVPPNRPAVNRLSNRACRVEIETNHPLAKRLKFKVTYISR